MFTSFSTALSALNAASTAIDVVGNNLANLNTTGYKTNTVSFRDMVAQSLGAGLAVPQTVRQFNQGAVQSNGGAFDAAIQGEGFFVVRDASTNATLYTRAGDFTMDGAGNLLTSSGQSVQGWNAINGELATGGPVSDISVPVEQLRKPEPTTELSMHLNLDAGATPGSQESKFTTSIQVVDALGKPLLLTVNFTKVPDSPGEWQYQITVPGEATVDGTPGTPTELLAQPGSLKFGGDGILVDPDAAAGGIQITVPGLNDGAADLNITWKLYDEVTGAPSLTQLAQPSAVSVNAQNGQAAAQLLRVSIGDGGKVMGQYTDGSQVVLAQLALASIRNPTSLVGAGNNNFRITAETASPVVGAPGTGGRGDIVGSALEGSTVDIATEFTNLIRFQRAYQANGKVVTTLDQLSQETISLTRG